MKKLFSLVLAISMIASLGAVAFAATDDVTADEMIQGIDSTYYYTEKDGVLNKQETTADLPLAYGKVAYFALFCTDNSESGGILSEAVVRYDVVKGIKPKITYEMGGSLIESVEIVKKKIAADAATSFGSHPAFYAYFLAVKVKSSTSTSVADVIGEITLKKSGQVDPDAEVYEGADFSFSVGFRSAVPASDGKTLKDSARVYAFKGNGTTAEYEEDEEFEFELYGDAGYFIVNTVGQGKLVLWNTTKFNADVAAKYPEANLDFINGCGASFNKTGELYLYADEGSYLYALKADGTLAAVKAEYDEYEEAFLVKTRTLGSYVISDVELELAPAVVTPTEPAAPANPSTGAAA